MVLFCFGFNYEFMMVSEGILGFCSVGFRRVALLSGGDVLGLLLFAAGGRFSHGLPVLDVETFHTADPFIAGWFLLDLLF